LTDEPNFRALLAWAIDGYHLKYAQGIAQQPPPRKPGGLRVAQKHIERNGKLWWNLNRPDLLILPNISAERETG